MQNIKTNVKSNILLSLMLLLSTMSPSIANPNNSQDCNSQKNCTGISSINENLNNLNSNATNLNTLQQKQLESGAVLIGLREMDGVKYVSGRIIINASPDKVWPIMVNPYEFKQKISPRMKDVRVLLDKESESVLKVTLDVPFPLPKVTYIVKSDYEKSKSVKFRRIGGLIKDFRGSWEMRPCEGGRKTDLIYCMYIDPGFPVPQFIIREGVKMELPSTLVALKKRVQSINENNQPVKKTILAALNTNSKTVH